MRRSSRLQGWGFWSSIEAQAVFHAVSATDICTIHTVDFRGFLVACKSYPF
jgi:hypothetical protein